MVVVDLGRNFEDWDQKMVNFFESQESIKKANKNVGKHMNFPLGGLNERTCTFLKKL